MVSDRFPDRSTYNSIGGVRESLVAQVGGDLHGDVHLHQNLLRNTMPLPPTNTWPKVENKAPQSIGVHPVRQGEGLSPLPPYVPRDVDAELRSRVREAGRSGGFVLVTGPSSVGKSRTAFEAVRAELPGHRFLAPAEDDDLAGLPELARTFKLRQGLVLWLDDLNRYLYRNALDLTLLDRLIEARVAVIATINDKRFKDLLDKTGSSDGAGRLIRATTPVSIGRVWTADEIGRVAETDDERLTAALQAQGTEARVSEHLVAGPQVLWEWRLAREPGEDHHPRGHALVAAALDLSEAGIIRAMPAETLEGLHHLYLDEDAEPEPWEEAWRWARELRHGVARLLVQDETDPNAWHPYHYLLETAHRPDEEKVPESVWDAALPLLDDLPDRFFYGFAALTEGREGHFTEALRPSIEEAGPLLSITYRALGFDEAADRAWDLAVEMDPGRSLYELGSLMLAVEGPDEEAVDLLRSAVEQGESKALGMIGYALEKRGEHEKAEHWYCAGAEAGDPRAMVSMGILLQTSGHEEAASRWFGRAAESGHPTVLYTVGVELCERGEQEQGLPMICEASTQGVRPADLYIGTRHHSEGRFDEAERLYRTVAELRDEGWPELASTATEHLAILFEDQERWEEAEDQWRVVMEHEPGKVEHGLSLASLLYRRRRFDEAAEVLRPYAQAKDPKAMYALHEVLEKANRPRAAKRWLRRWGGVKYRRELRRRERTLWTIVAAYMVPQTVLVGGLTGSGTALLPLGAILLLTVLALPYVFARRWSLPRRPWIPLVTAALLLVGLTPAALLGSETGLWVLLNLPVNVAGIGIACHHFGIFAPPEDSEVPEDTSEPE